MLIRIYNLSILFVVAFSCLSCGGDETDFGDDNADGRVGACVESDGTDDDLVGTWDLSAIQGVPDDVSINGPLEFFSTGTYDFTAQVDTPDYFVNYQNQSGSYSYTNSENLLATTGAFATIFSNEITIQFCNDNSQFTFLDANTDGRRHTYVKR